MVLRVKVFEDEVLDLEWILNVAVCAQHSQAPHSGGGEGR